MLQSENIKNKTKRLSLSQYHSILQLEVGNIITALFYCTKIFKKTSIKMFCLRHDTDLMFCSKSCCPTSFSYKIVQFSIHASLVC